ncbi:MAG TPA: HEAT repeat domain-containing protein, partial [bacterium]|nr:HEAT repeat domain-containing protein [bacterium]
KNENPVIKIEGARALLKVDREIGLSTLREIQKEKDVDIRLKAALVLIEEKEKEGIGYLIDLLGTKAHKEARTYLEKITQKNFGRIPPVVSKERLEEYIGRWKDWWEKNKGTFKFPEEKQQNQNQ